MDKVKKAIYECKCESAGDNISTSCSLHGGSIEYRNYCPRCSRLDKVTVEELSKTIDDRLRKDTGQNIWGGCPYITPYMIAQAVLDYLRGIKEGE